MELKLPIPVTPENKFLVTLQIVKFLKPFSKMRPRELEVYAELLYYNHKWKDLPERERCKLIFDYDTRIKIAEKLDITVDNLYIIMQGLKKKNLIIGNGARNAEVLNPYYAERFSNQDTISFVLIDNHQQKQ